MTDRHTAEFQVELLEELTKQTALLTAIKDLLLKSVDKQDDINCSVIDVETAVDALLKEMR